MQCPNCGCENSNGRFCKECGTGLAMQGNPDIFQPAKSKLPLALIIIGIVLAVAVVLGVVNRLVVTNNRLPSLTALAEDIVNGPLPYKEFDESLTYPEGTYLVGGDIPAGEYAVFATTGRSCYVETNERKRQDFSTLLANESTNTQHFVSVENGQYFTVQRGEFTLAKNIGPLVPEDGIWHEGTWRVGIDIEPGKYYAHADDNGIGCFIQVRSSSYGDYDNIVLQRYIDSGGMGVVYLNEGEYLHVYDGYLVP